MGVQIIYTTFGALLIQDDAGSSSLTKLFAQACEDAASVAFHAMGGVFWCRDRYWLCSHGSSAAMALLGMSRQRRWWGCWPAQCAESAYDS